MGRGTLAGLWPSLCLSPRSYQALGTWVNKGIKKGRSLEAMTLAHILFGYSESITDMPPG
jgi:hypothetical protein